MTNITADSADSADSADITDSADTADITAAGSFRLGGHAVNRLGYGAMQFAGPGVFGPPKDRDAALAVLREAVASGVNHIDTSDYYGPHITNRLIHAAQRDADAVILPMSILHVVAE